MFYMFSITELEIKLLSKYITTLTRYILIHLSLKMKCDFNFITET